MLILFKAVREYFFFHPANKNPEVKKGIRIHLKVVSEFIKDHPGFLHVFHGKHVLVRL